MKRRDFLTASCLAGIAPLSSIAQAAGGGSKQYLELRLYTLESQEQQEALLKFFGDALIPALGRIGIGPVGVFTVLPREKTSITEATPNVYVLTPHESLESVVTMLPKLAGDDAFMDAGAELIDLPKSDPAYTRIESTLMLAFDEIPKLEVPVTSDARVFQLRIYESHSVKMGQRKIEMFNEGGEIGVFRSTGLSPVFFGESIIGSKLPNLTYMVGSEDMDANEKAWAAFRAHPDWLKLKADPYYKDTVSNITNIFLRPAACSQI